ncbi:MAG: high-affinity branched-chain amino acid ABC transporter permease LivM [Desulfovibrio sp.]|nr:high-affinity branched-chain amino acid ABC transporter permease LivM [Desulfovibrio sp.]MCA1985972.1 high-affinity branched-chain amino acid ABC transporter permease LivM [Desulfovibrio sp.]
MTLGSRHARLWLGLAVGLVWFALLLFPLLGITPDGLTLQATWEVLKSVVLAGVAIVGLVSLSHLPAAGGIRRAVGAAQAGTTAAAARVPGVVWAVLMLAALVAYPQLVGRYGVDVAVNVLVYVCLGLGLNVVVGLCGLLDLGYIAFYGVGAYTYAILATQFGVSFWVCLPIAAVLAAVAGACIGYPTLRMRGDYLAIVTLGFGEIIRIVINNWMSLTNGPNGIISIPPPGFYALVFDGGVSLEHILLRKLDQMYYVVLVLAVITVIAVRRLNFSRIGRAWEAIREDETAAELMGVNTFRFKLLAYAMGAVFGGLAGAFFAARMKSVAPNSFSFIESALVLAMVVLGGLGSIPGIVLGALALIALPEVFREFEQYRMLVFGGAMAVMMLVRPQGLIPATRMGKRGEDDA